MFYYLMTVVAVSRLVYFRDSALRPTTVWAVVGFQTLALALLKPSVWVAAYAALMAAANWAFHRCERRSLTTNGLRVLLLVTQASLAAVLSSAVANVSFQWWLTAAPGVLARYAWVPRFAQAIDLTRVGIVVLGFLLVANEANLLIRYLFERFQLVTPLVSREPPYLISLDRREYGAGRLIGILERVLIYILVLNGQFAVIGFVLAAKSFTRFRQLEERRFAEYVLIGTLLSALTAILVSLLVRALIQ